MTRRFDHSEEVLLKSKAEKRAFAQGHSKGASERAETLRLHLLGYEKSKVEYEASIQSLKQNHEDEIKRYKEVIAKEINKNDTLIMFIDKILSLLGANKI